MKNLGSVTIGGINNKYWRSSEEGENSEGQYGRTFLEELGSDMLHRKGILRA